MMEPPLDITDCAIITDPKILQAIVDEGMSYIKYAGEWK